MTLSLGAVISVLVGILTLGLAVFQAGRWVGKHEGKGTTDAERIRLGQLEALWDRHMSDHRGLAGKVEEARDKARDAYQSIHDEEKRR